MKPMTYSVGIVGLGNIGMMYDQDIESKDLFLSHAKSFYHHPAFEVQFLADVDEKQRQHAAVKFPTIKTVSQLSEIAILPDVLVLSANQSVNIQLLEKYIDEPAVKLIVVEKPLWNDSMDKSFWEKPGRSEKVFVNYIRKYLPFFEELKINIGTQQYGKCLSTNVLYSKGLRNNGSHIIDLFFSLFSASEIQCVSVFNEVQDHLPEDSSISFTGTIKSGENSFPVVFSAVDETKFSLIEIDLIFEKKRFRFSEFGEKVEEYGVKNDEVYAGYKNLVSNRKLKSTKMNKYGYFLCDKLKSILQSEDKNNSSVKHEQAIFETIKKIKYFE